MASVTGVSPHSFVPPARSGLPPPWRQVQLIEDLKAQYGILYTENQPFYLVSAEWYGKWKRFSNFNSASSPVQANSPGPIDNSPLIDEEAQADIDATGEEVVLKPDRLALLDYCLLPEQAWVALRQWHGGGPEIKRFTILQANGTLDVEIYPYTFQVSMANFVHGDWDYGLARSVQYSRKTTVKELVEDIKEMLLPLYRETIEDYVRAGNGKEREGYLKDNGATEFRLQMARYGDNFGEIMLTQLKMSNSLEDLQILTNAAQKVKFLLVAQRSDGTWPTENKLSSFSNADGFKSSSASTTIDTSFKAGGDLEYLERMDAESRNAQNNFYRSKPNFFETLAPLMAQKETTVRKPVTSYVGSYGSSSNGYQGFNSQNYTGYSLVNRGDNARKKKEKDEKVTCGVAATGLANLGNTCFMNSVLQCLAHTELFVNYMLENEFIGATEETESIKGKEKESEGNGNLSKECLKEMKDVLTLLHSEKHSVVFLSRFKAFVGKWNKRFRGYRQHDAEEFLSFILDRMAEEANLDYVTEPIENHPAEEQPQEAVLEVVGDGTQVNEAAENGDDDNEKAAEEYQTLYKQKYDSFVLDMFRGLFRSDLECQDCSNTTSSFEPFLVLSLAIPSVRPSSLSTKRPKLGQEMVTLQDCIEEFIKRESLGDKETWYCSACNVRFKESASSMKEIIMIC